MPSSNDLLLTVQVRNLASAEVKNLISSIREFRSAVTETSTSFKSLGAGLADAMKSLTADVTAIRDALRGVASETANIGKAVADLRAARAVSAREGAKAVADETAEVRLLTSELTKAKTEYDKLSGADLSTIRQLNPNVKNMGAATAWYRNEANKDQLFRAQTLSTLEARASAASEFTATTRKEAAEQYMRQLAPEYFSPTGRVLNQGEFAAYLGGHEGRQASAAANTQASEAFNQIQASLGRSVAAETRAAQLAEERAIAAGHNFGRAELLEKLRLRQKERSVTDEDKLEAQVLVNRRLAETRQLEAKSRLFEQELAQQQRLIQEQAQMRETARAAGAAGRGPAPLTPAQQHIREQHEAWKQQMLEVAYKNISDFEAQTGQQIIPGDTQEERVKNLGEAFQELARTNSTAFQQVKRNMGGFDNDMRLMSSQTRRHIVSMAANFLMMGDPIYAVRHIIRMLSFELVLHGQRWLELVVQMQKAKAASQEITKSGFSANALATLMKAMPGGATPAQMLGEEVLPGGAMLKNDALTFGAAGAGAKIGAETTGIMASLKAGVAGAVGVLGVPGTLAVAAVGVAALAMGIGQLLGAYQRLSKEQERNVELARAFARQDYAGLTEGIDKLGSEFLLLEERQKNFWTALMQGARDAFAVLFTGMTRAQEIALEITQRTRTQTQIGKEFEIPRLEAQQRVADVQAAVERTQWQTGLEVLPEEYRARRRAESAAKERLFFEQWGQEPYEPTTQESLTRGAQGEEFKKTFAKRRAEVEEQLRPVQATLKEFEQKEANAEELAAEYRRQGFVRNKEEEVALARQLKTLTKEEMADAGQVAEAIVIAAAWRERSVAIAKRQLELSQSEVETAKQYGNLLSTQQQGISKITAEQAKQAQSAATLARDLYDAPSTDVLTYEARLTDMVEKRRAALRATQQSEREAAQANVTAALAAVQGSQNPEADTRVQAARAAQARLPVIQAGQRKELETELGKVKRDAEAKFPIELRLVLARTDEVMRQAVAQARELSFATSERALQAAPNVEVFDTMLEQQRRQNAMRREDELAAIAAQEKEAELLRKREMQGKSDFDRQQREATDEARFRAARALALERATQRELQTEEMAVTRRAELANQERAQWLAFQNQRAQILESRAGQAQTYEAFEAYTLAAQEAADTAFALQVESMRATLTAEKLNANQRLGDTAEYLATARALEDKYQRDRMTMDDAFVERHLQNERKLLDAQVQFANQRRALEGQMAEQRAAVFGNLAQEQTNPQAFEEYAARQTAQLEIAREKELEAQRAADVRRLDDVRKTQQDYLNMQSVLADAELRNNNQTSIDLVEIKRQQAEDILKIETDNALARILLEERWAERVRQLNEQVARERYARSDQGIVVENMARNLGDLKNTLGSAFAEFMTTGEMTWAKLWQGLWQSMARSAANVLTDLLFKPFEVAMADMRKSVIDSMNPANGGTAATGNLSPGGGGWLGLLGQGAEKAWDWMRGVTPTGPSTLATANNDISTASGMFAAELSDSSQQIVASNAELSESNKSIWQMLLAPFEALIAAITANTAAQGASDVGGGGGGGGLLGWLGSLFGGGGGGGAGAGASPGIDTSAGMFAADMSALGAARGGVIEAFAEGGIVTVPTRALIGEDGPEAIIPLRPTGSFGPAGSWGSLSAAQRSQALAAMVAAGGSTQPTLSDYRVWNGIIYAKTAEGGWRPISPAAAKADYDVDTSTFGEGGGSDQGAGKGGRGTRGSDSWGGLTASQAMNLGRMGMLTGSPLGLAAFGALGLIGYGATLAGVEPGYDPFGGLTPADIQDVRDYQGAYAAGELEAARSQIEANLASIAATRTSLEDAQSLPGMYAGEPTGYGSGPAGWGGASSAPSASIGVMGSQSPSDAPGGFGYGYGGEGRSSGSPDASPTGVGAAPQGDTPEANSQGPGNDPGGIGHDAGNTGEAGYAKGGVKRVTRKTRAIFGEGGEPETGIFIPQHMQQPGIQSQEEKTVIDAMIRALAKLTGRNVEEIATPLAEGGIVTRKTLALIGEKGPEAVIPLRRGAAPVSPPRATDTVTPGRSSDTTIINVFKEEDFQAAMAAAVARGSRVVVNDIIAGLAGNRAIRRSIQRTS